MIYFDNYTTISDIVKWVSEPIDIKERSDRLIKAFNSSDVFRFLINDQFVERKFNYNGVLSLGELELRPPRGHEADKYSASELINDLAWHRSDESGSIPSIARSAIIQRLDYAREGDLPYLLKYIKGEELFSGKINEQLLKLSNLGNVQPQ